MKAGKKLSIVVVELRDFYLNQGLWCVVELDQGDVTVVSHNSGGLSCSVEERSVRVSAQWVKTIKSQNC